MSNHTLIEWTDATWNPITGCSAVSEGCRNCYAAELAGTRLRHHASRAGLTRESGGRHVWNGAVRFNEQWLDQPLRWKKPRRIFVCAHADLFHENVPDEWINKVFGVMAQAPWHTFQVLTKRPKRMGDWINGYIRSSVVEGIQIGDSTLTFESVFSHVWFGVSAEDQAAADARIPLLLQIPAAVRWVSVEPMLGPVNLPLARIASWNRLATASNQEYVCTSIDWVVCGGESGKDARPMHPQWARGLRDQCAAAGVAFMFKQWGEWWGASVEHPQLATIETGGIALLPSGERAAGPQYLGATLMQRIGKSAAGRLLDGVLHDAYPEPHP